MFLIICVERITSHWQPLFSKKMVATASFSYKIAGGGLICLQNWRRRQGFGNITGGCSDMVWILVFYDEFSLNHTPGVGNMTFLVKIVHPWVVNRTYLIKILPPGL